MTQHLSLLVEAVPQRLLSREQWPHLSERLRQEIKKVIQPHLTKQPTEILKLERVRRSRRKETYYKC